MRLEAPNWLVKKNQKKKLIQKQNKYRIHTNTLNYKADKKKKYTKIEKEI